MMNTIQPLFSDQQSITEAVNKLSPEQRAKYDQLLSEYQELISSNIPDHERIAELISEAQKLLMLIPPEINSTTYSFNLTK